MPRILHFGLGAFHRAHQAPFTQDAGGDWRIEAVSMRNPALSDALNASGGRYHLIERAAEGPRVKMIDVIDRAHCLATAPRETVARLADPEVSIATITVTEKGYGFHPPTRGLDPTHAAVAADLVDPRAPTGLIGALVEGLRLRHAAGLAGLTVMSCDNLTGNGRLVAQLVDDFARPLDADLANWIAASCAFPDTMVDRITPASTNDTLDTVKRATGISDPLAVETEPFRQWVIEDWFAGPRPAWEAAGARLVADVAPYEMMKLRMLNGAHSMIAYLGVVGGLDAVRDVVADPGLRRLVAAHMRAASATLAPIPGFDFETYGNALLTRFENPSIRHLCRQIAADGSLKMPQRIFAAAADALTAGSDAAACALATATWLRFLHGVDETGADIAVVDPRGHELTDAVTAARGTSSDIVDAVAKTLGIVDRSPFAVPAWRDAVATYLDALLRTGVRALAEAHPHAH